MPLTRAPKTLPVLHLLRKLPQPLHSPPDNTPCPPTSIEQPISEQQNRINILGSTTLARSPRKSLGQVRYPMGRSVTPPARLAHTHRGVWHGCCSSWSRAKPLFLWEEQTAWPVNTSIPSALSLAGTSALHNKTLSPQSSFHTLELLKVTLGITVQGKIREKQSKLVYFGPLAAICVWPHQFPQQQQTCCA